MKNVLKVLAGVAVASAFAACGGGGGGSSDNSGGSTYTLYYPYKTVYGDVCANTEPTPGCTFLVSNGKRITVSVDPDYNKYGYGSDDLWYVQFDSAGNAKVYNDLGQYQYTADASKFAGYVGGTTIGVGTTGMYWENVSNGTYWLGKNGVLTLRTQVLQTTAKRSTTKLRVKLLTRISRL